MSGEAALPRLELPKQPYRSRYYRDQAFGRLTGKPLTIISQKNPNTSTILNNFLAGLDSINNSGSRLDSKSHFKDQFSKEKIQVKESPKDLQGKKKSSAARSLLHRPENNQSHHVAETFTGYCRSSKQTESRLVPAAVADDKVNVDGGGDGVDDERELVDEVEEPLIGVEALVPQADVSIVEKFGITYNAETSVVYSTPNPSRLSEEAKPKMRLCFNTNITPIVLKSPFVGIKEKNIAPSTSRIEKHKTSSNCFGKIPAVSAFPPPALVVPSISTPKRNDTEFELMEEESFSFESLVTIPKKTQVLSQKPDEQAKKSVSNIKEVKKKEKHQKTARKEVAVTDEKEERLQSEPLSLLKQLEGKKTSKLNKLPKPGEAGKRSAVRLLKKNAEEEQEELQNEPSSASKLSLTPKQKTKLEHGKSGKKCMSVESNRDKSELFQEEPPLCVAEKANRMEKSKVSEQDAVNCKNSAESGSSVSLPNEVASNRKTAKRILHTGPETPNKTKVVKGPVSSDHYSLTKCVDVVSVPLTETIADDENDKLAAFETHKPRTSLFNGKAKEATVNSSRTLSRLPQRINSKGPSLNASETPAVMNSICVDNKQNGYPTENVVPSTSGLEKQKKEQASLFTKSSFYRFGIKPAVSALPQPKPVISITSALNHEFEFELEEEESFCFESWITIPKKAVVPNQDPTEQGKKSVSDAKETKKKEKRQKTEATRKEVAIQSKKNDEKQLAWNKKSKAKNENQPKESGKRSACLLKNNKTVVNTEKEQQEIQNVPLSHSKHLLSPKHTKLELKLRPLRNKSIVESDGDEEQGELQEQRKEPHFCVEENGSGTEKSSQSEQGTITSEKLPESESSINLPRVLHSDEKKSKLTLFAKPRTPNKNKKKAKKEQKPKVKANKILKKETQPKKPGNSKKCFPSPSELDESDPQGNAMDVYTRSRRLTRPPPKWWVVQHANNHPQMRLKTDYLPAFNASLQDGMAEAQSLKSQMKKKQMVLKRSAACAQTKTLQTEVCSSDKQTFEEDVFENECSLDSPPHSQSKPTRQQRTANQQDNHSGRVSDKKQSRKRKYASAPSIPKKRLFPEAEEEKTKPSDMHLTKKQKSILKQKVHNFDVHNENEMEEEEEEYSPLSRPAHVCATSRQTKDYITSLPSKPTSQKFFRESLASFGAAYVDKTLQKSADGLPAISKVSSGTPNRIVMSPRNYGTVKYRDKTVPSQHYEQTPDESEEDNEPEPSTSVQRKRTLKQGLPCSGVPVFNKSGPGPSAKYEEQTDAGDNRNFDHEEMMDLDDANEDDSYTKESTSEKSGQSNTASTIDQTDTDPGYNCEGEPPEVAIQEHLKPTCVWSVKESSEIFVDCVQTSEMCSFFYPLKTEYEDNKSIAISKSLNWKTFSCGKLVLGPYKEKGCQMVYKDTMIFHILKGDLGITIYRTTYHLKEGDYFFVPSGNTYNVTNLLDTEAVLLFTQLKGAKMD
uniref:centromere protein C-like isoform X2 n=1 Tax=Pristiophorus japonicus TaxID=55135 RepID=UPI00398ECC15